MPTVACPDCASTNRVPQERLGDNPRCGRCGSPLFQGKPVTLTAANFDRHLAAETPLLVDFWAAWCGPCKQLTPVLEKLVRSYGGKVRLVKINVDENQAIAAQLRVQSLPTVYAFRDGQPLDGFVGGQPEKTLRAFIDRLVAEDAADDIEGVLKTGDELILLDEPLAVV